jgi:dihydroorotate dehydrogenase (NAD+) catalytic subunit
MAELATRVGSIALRAPVMTASGASGHGAELAPYGPLRQLGAVVVKSLSDGPWPGNPPPRLRPLRSPAAGMINSVGLQGRGVAAWLDDDLPALIDEGVDVVASIWGDTVDAYRRAAELLAAGPAQIVAVEVNVSCPNTEDGMRMFAHSAEATEAVLAATAGCGRPRWAKLSPNTPELVAMASAAVLGGAEAVVLTNTLSGLVIDIEQRRPALGGRRGGVSGAALHPVAVRAVYDVREALPEVPIVGVGGVASGADAVEMLMAGAAAVQVGTAIFANPRAPWRVLAELEQWCDDNDVAGPAELVGAAH